MEILDIIPYNSFDYRKIKTEKKSKKFQSEKIKTPVRGTLKMKFF